MFRAKTVLVLGAGASFEVGLPTGPQLLKNIVQILDIKYEHFSRQISGDRYVPNALKSILNEGQSVDKYNEHLHACWQIGSSAKQAISIDNLIDGLEDEKIDLVGKIGIVRAIHLAEASAPKFSPIQEWSQAFELENFEQTWYDQLTKLLTEGVKVSQVDSIFDNLEIISFNYDRCIEHYLPFSISNYYGKKIEECRELISTLKIHRPYGVAGKLPWQPGDAPQMAFGGNNSDQLAQVSNMIKTFTEQIEEEEALEAMKGALRTADRVIFLGFAFHRQNIELLSVNLKTDVEILATAYGISDNDRKVIIDELEKAFSPVSGEISINLYNETCHGFFKNNWRKITSEHISAY